MKTMKLNNPTVSIVVPIHDMQGGDAFLWRLVNSLVAQTFTDWELIITKEGKMAENTNAGIRRARGKYVKVLYLDDYFNSDKALEDMVTAIDATTHNWLIAGATTNPHPHWTEDIETGNNRLGSPSALMFRNMLANNVLFDETLSCIS